jgi:SagB-type dehydrogenase family enzyme
MHKLLWVALPLLVGLALLAVQVLRRRPPSRHALNIWSSLLLAGYVLATAGLGLFWVANQQLPAFDWHYLFGYLTLLLVLLHLLFNFRIVWRHFTRPRASEPAAPIAHPVRRRALGVVGVLLATGTAYLLGWRQGRSGLAQRETTAQGSADTTASALAAIERYHAMTSHSRAGVLLRAPAVTWGTPPPAFKPVAVTAERFALPPAGTAPGAPDSVASLAAVLWHTAGITATRGPLRLRASPSSGALFSTELYVVARRVVGLAPGLWHYDPSAHALVRLGAEAADDEALGAPAEPPLREAHAALIATAVFRRSGHKYGDRTYRYVLADLGHALENLRVAAAATGGQAHVITRFDEARAAATLDVDEGEEGVLALLALRPAGSASTPPAPHWQPLAAPSPPRAEALGVTSRLHRASSLRAAVPPAAASAEVDPPATAEAIALPAPTHAQRSVFALIATRRSVRRFAPTPLSLDALGDVLDAVSGRGETALSPALRVGVVAHAVSGLPPGAYRYEPARHALLPRLSATTTADLRTAAGAAALDQAVIADAAAVFVLSIARAAFAADPSGPARGYRHAFLEAGRVGERIYLAASARGLGACAVGAFYDDEASALVAIDPAREWVVHFAALGVPAE